MLLLKRHLTLALRAEPNAGASRRNKRRRFAPNQNAGASHQVKTPALRAESKRRRFAPSKNKTPTLCAVPKRRRFAPINNSGAPWRSQPEIK
jgi:hypothetical protein